MIMIVTSQILKLQHGCNGVADMGSLINVKKRHHLDPNNSENDVSETVVAPPPGSRVSKDRHFRGETLLKLLS